MEEGKEGSREGKGAAAFILSKTWLHRHTELLSESDRREVGGQILTHGQTHSLTYYIRYSFLMPQSRAKLYLKNIIAQQMGDPDHDMS